MIDDWHDLLETWVADSKGKIRGDKAHDKLVALGYTGTDRTTRRALADIKAQWRLGNTRVHRPWVTEPGLWLQYDFADGPLVAGRKIVLLVAWLAWSRYRVVIALRDRTSPSVFAGLDRIFRIVGGAPTYLLTDNEKTVTTGHIAGVPVRNRAAVTFGRYYGISVLTCEPADPASEGGVENAVKLAKADTRPICCRSTPPSPTWRQPARGLSLRSMPGCTAARAGVRSRCSPRNAPPCTRYPTCPTPPHWE
jgi:Integrase core domain